MKLFEYAWDDYLLVEGRENDVLNKHPWFDTAVLKILSENDPSGNNKYLMWMADRFAETAIRMFYYDELGKSVSFIRVMFSGRGGPDVAKTYFKKEQHYEGYKDKAKQEFAKYLEKPSYDGDPIYDTNIPFLVKIFYLVNRFHKLLPYMKNKDLYFYKSHMNLVDALKNAEKAYAAKVEKRALKNAAKKGGRIIWEFGNIAAIRPLTKEASCLFGKQTKWCISATESTNYFQEYTARGQMFYFLFLPGATTPEWKKIALVFSPERDGWTSMYNAEDGGMDNPDLNEAWNEVKPSDFSEDKWNKVLHKVVKLMEKDAESDIPWSEERAKKIFFRWESRRVDRQMEKYEAGFRQPTEEGIDIDIYTNEEGQVVVEADMMYEFAISQRHTDKASSMETRGTNSPEAKESGYTDYERGLIKKAVDSTNDSFSRLKKGESLPGPAPQIPAEISNSLLHYKVMTFQNNLIPHYNFEGTKRWDNIKLFLQAPELEKRVLNNEEELEKFLALVWEQEEAIWRAAEVAYTNGGTASKGLDRLLLPGLAEEGIY